MLLASLWDFYPQTYNKLFATGRQQVQDMMKTAIYRSVQSSTLPQQHRL